MVVKEITYEDFNGETRKEKFYFNLTEAEVFNMQFGTVKGGLDVLVKKMIETEDTPALVKLFQDLILNSYGEKSDDGKRFIKSEEMKEGFKQTNAYSELVMELVSDENKAADFVNALVPKKLSEKAKELEDKGDLNVIMGEN